VGRRGFKIVFEITYFLVALAPLGMLTYAWHARFPSTDWGHGILVWGWCFAFYLKKFFCPSPMVLLYELPHPVAWTSPEYFSALAITAIFVAVAYLFRKNRLVLWGMGFYLATIFFLLRFDSKVDFNMVADRFTYLPSLGLCFVCGVWADGMNSKFKERIFLKMLLLASGAMILLTFAAQTYAQTKVWQNSATLWENQIRYHPAAAPPLVRYKLAEAYSQQEEFKTEVDIYRRTGKIMPTLGEPLPFINRPFT